MTVDSSQLDLCEGVSFSTAIFNSDIQRKTGITCQESIEDNHGMQAVGPRHAEDSYDDHHRSQHHHTSVRELLGQKVGKRSWGEPKMVNITHKSHT